jgi:hypothetical protein
MFRIVARVQRISANLTSAFIAVWLVVFSLGGATLISAFASPADTTQAAAPADSDDHSEDVAALDDCALQNRRIELHVPDQVISRLTFSRPVFNPPVGRLTTSFVPPHVWQFAERTAASPRAPSFRA